MFNRAEKVDQNFKKFVREGHLPQAKSFLTAQQTGLKPPEVIDLFESQVISRQLDIQARKLKAQGLCYYTIGSAGHEGNAAVGKVFRPTDMAFLHYRSAAFMVQRFKQQPGSTPLYDLLLSFTASKDEPIAGGRHKVFGSYDLLVPPQTSTIASHLPKAVGAALSIQRAKDLKVDSRMSEDSVVTCSFGDASANHSTALGAFNTAAWIAYQNLQLPLVFICEDNRLGISVPTPEHWVNAAFSSRPCIEYIKCDGLNLLDVYLKTKQAEVTARVKRRPVFLHMETVRLLGHAGSDVESTYQTNAKIESTEMDDPLLHSARIVIENGWLSAEEVISMYEGVGKQIERVAAYVITRPPLQDPKEVATAVVANCHPRKAPEIASEDSRKVLFGREYDKLNTPQHMAKLLNWALTDILARYPNTLVFGEDVALKGGVYHVTDGLYKRFGARRVFNSLLDEQAIIGTGIGMAHNGFVPIPEIQFLAYVHNAEDQIRSEAATLAFFSQGQYTNPMVLRIAGLAYQKGFGGHFHNDNSIAVFRDIPGLVIAIPANGADAVKMLRTCVREAYENGRVCIFIEPIARYMSKDLYEEGDKAWSFKYPKVEEEIPMGEFAVHGSGEDLTILTYGNGTYYSLQAAKKLKDEYAIDARVIDLRWVAPLQEQKLLLTLADSKNILLVEECRKTGSFAEGLSMMILEKLRPIPNVKVVAAQDSFIPLGKAAAAGLPKVPEIITGALHLLGKGEGRND